MKFLVTVVCLVHFKACPLPDGYKAEHVAPDKKTCVNAAKSIVTTLGYAVADFRIVCKEK